MNQGHIKTKLNVEPRAYKNQCWPALMHSDVTSNIKRSKIKVTGYIHVSLHVTALIASNLIDIVHNPWICRIECAWYRVPVLNYGYAVWCVFYDSHIKWWWWCGDDVNGNDKHTPPHVYDWHEAQMLQKI